MRIVTVDERIKELPAIWKHCFYGGHGWAKVQTNFKTTDSEQVYNEMLACTPLTLPDLVRFGVDHWVLLECDECHKSVQSAFEFTGKRSLTTVRVCETCLSNITKSIKKD